MNAKFFNRDLSWVEFNARVGREASRKDVPLLERLKFISIAASNFDEFFQVRVASINRNIKSNPREHDSSGMNYSTVLNKISERVHELCRTHNSVLMDDIIPSLSRNGWTYVEPQKFTTAQKNYAERFFRHEIFPLLTPLRTDSENFPHIANSTLCAAFLLEPIEGVNYLENSLGPKEEKLIALVPLPQSIPHVIWLPSDENEKSFALISDVIQTFGDQLFPGFLSKQSMIFYINRDADFGVNEDSGNDFIEAMEEVLVQRESSLPVRLVCNSTSEELLEELKNRLKLDDSIIYKYSGIIDFNSLMEIYDEAKSNESLVYPEWKNFSNAEFPKDESIWNILREKDVLLNVPYENYDSVLRFLKDASKDESVLAIKITLYRTGNASPIVQALKEAVQNGKQVTAFVELKARFDEKRNISWVKELEKAGAIVIYGIQNLKVHAKICLVVRKEGDEIRRYVHFSTGNYNPKTAKIYQDLSVFTSNREITHDATLFFNVISGYSAIQTMHNLYMAPVTLKSKLIELIDREIALSSKDRPGHIVAKMNSLCHPEIISKLYEASCSNVKVELNVRGICTLVPGVQSLSSNIKVVSVIDRYLEHSRIIYFENAGNAELYLSSADWMERNLDRRIELMIPIKDEKVFDRIKEILFMYFNDNSHSFVLQKDGSWKQNMPEKNEVECRIQEVLYKKYKKRHDEKKKQNLEEFVVRRKN